MAAIAEGQAEGPDPFYAKVCGDTTRRLTSEEIQDRLKRFRASSPRDWSVFDDVPPSQHVDVMYPEVIDLNRILKC